MTIYKILPKQLWLEAMETGGNVFFQWEGSRSWSASASITEASLTVSYDLLMQMSDFVNAVYQRAQ